MYARCRQASPATLFGGEAGLAWRHRAYISCGGGVARFVSGGAHRLDYAPEMEIAGRKQPACRGGVHGRDAIAAIGAGNDRPGAQITVGCQYRLSRTLEIRRLAFSQRSEAKNWLFFGNNPRVWRAHPLHRTSESFQGAYRRTKWRAFLTRRSKARCGSGDSGDFSGGSSGAVQLPSGTWD